MYSQWTSTDRSILEFRVEAVDDFIGSLIKRLTTLIRHTFISEQQNFYLKELKLTLGNEEAIILMDFSENYTFIIQDSVQGYHWTNDQFTIHPFEIYFRDQEGKLQHTNLVVISNCRYT